MTQTPLLQINSLRKRYPGAAAPALDGVSLSVEPGECFGLLGPNGAGKTTLLSLVCGLLKPDSGSLSLGGAGRLGLVPQDIALYPSLDGRENLLFFGRMQGLGGPSLERLAQALLKELGLAEQAGKRVEAYSGGMKRRLNLAVGLLTKPDLLVLDEPTVGVDPQSRLLIHEALARLNQSGTSLLYTTHYLKEAEALCGRVAILDHGRLIAEGSPAELLSAHPGCLSLDDVFLRLTGRQARDDA
jgi:ABC-2 type transport system ATP-binding protein